MRASNAPFSEQGFAEVIHDLERHELLLTNGGDTNPGSGTNNGYTDGPTTAQVASTVDNGIAGHVAQADPHAQYLLRTEYVSSSFVGTTLIYTANGSQTDATGTQITMTDFGVVVIDEFAGAFFNGVFTAPATGVYSFAFACHTSNGAFPVGPLSLSLVASTGKMYSTQVDYASRGTANIGISGAFYLLSGQTVTLKIQASVSGTTTLTNAVDTLSIIRLR